MARVLITGSTTGLGEAAALELLDGGHEVVLHARNPSRASSIDFARRATGVVVGELATFEEVRAIAGQVNAIGAIDAVIHNAGIYTDGGRAQILAVNVLAPYLLTALIPRPARLVYLSSGMHRSGNPSASAIDLTADGRDATQAYCDSKLYVTALAMALARHWPDVLVNAVDPGWVPTRMGGAGAPDDLELGHRTQTWLAVSDEREALTSGGYWHHQAREVPAAAALDDAFQSALLRALRSVTGVDITASA